MRKQSIPGLSSSRGRPGVEASRERVWQAVCNKNRIVTSAHCKLIWAPYKDERAQIRLILIPFDFALYGHHIRINSKANMGV